MNKILLLENPGTLKSCLINSILGKIKTQVSTHAERAWDPGHPNHGEEKEENAGNVTTTADGGQVYLEAAGPGAANQGSCRERRDRAREQGLLS